MGLNIAADMTRPLGPLPVWGWAALAGGGLLVFTAMHGNRTANKVLNPAVVTPAAPGDTSGGTPAGSQGSQFPPMSVQPGGSVYDPSTSTLSTAPPVSIRDILGGGSLSDFMGSLGQDWQSLDIHAGDTGVDATHAAQNVLNEQQFEAATAGNVAIQQALAAERAASAVAAYQAAAVNSQAGWGAWTSWMHDYFAGNVAHDTNFFNWLTPANGASPTGTAAPPPSNVGGGLMSGSGVSGANSDQCAPGNIGCIRTKCTTRDYACMARVAPWARGMERSVWG